MERQFIEYYLALKEVWVLHNQNRFGKSPDIPSGFSEALCRSLLKLSPSCSRKYDAIGEKGKVEIKATGTPEGKTTISRSQNFEVLYWMQFDFETDILKLYELSNSLFELDEGKARKSIRLASIVNQNNVEPVEYKFDTHRDNKA